MSNSMRDYTPGVGSYKTEEGGSIRGISATENVDHQMGTLTLNRQDISFDAPGTRISLSSRFNSDHLYASLIKQIASGAQPIKTLMTVPEGATCFYRIAHGWSWDLPCIRVGIDNVFKIVLGGTTYDLSSLLNSGVLEQSDKEIWLDGYHLKLGSYHDANYKHLVIAIMEAKAIIECEVCRSGSLPDYDYKIVNTSASPGTVLKLYAADGTMTLFDSTTGFIKSVTDPSGKNTLTYSYMDSSSAYTGTIQETPTPTRFQFAIGSEDYEALRAGDLITVWDNTRVVWEKKNGTTIALSGGLDFIPIGGQNTYIIGSARISKIAHSDGRAVKFYYYSRGLESYIVTLLSSDSNREHLNVGDLFLNKYAIDAKSRLVRFEVLDTVSSGQPMNDFDTGTARLGQVEDSRYFIPLQHNEYIYSLTSEPDPSTDVFTILNHAGAPTYYYFQKGGFRAHSYNQKNIFTGVVRKGSTTSLTLEKNDNIIEVGHYLGLSRPNYKTEVWRKPQSSDSDSYETVWDEKRKKVVDYYTACSDFVKIASLKGTNKYTLASPFTISPAKGDECLIVDDAFVLKEIKTTKDTPDSHPTWVFMDTTSTTAGMFLAIRNEVRQIKKVGSDDGSTYADVDHPFSFIPKFTTGKEHILLIKNDTGTNDFFVYYLNKPKVAKVVHKQSFEDMEWQAANYAYIYLKGGNETRDDSNGGGFIYADVDGPTTIKMAPDDIELVKTLVYSFQESTDNAEDFTQSVFTFQYDSFKRIMGEKEQKQFYREGSSWIPIDMTVNVIGHPCTQSEYYGVTSSYVYRNTCDYHETQGVPDDLNWKYYVDNDYDGWGRLIRSRKYADSLPGGQAICSWTEYVGIGTENEELDPYAKFWGNTYSSDYQSIFNAKRCFEVVGATISKINSEGLNAATYNKYDDLLNIIESKTVESTLLSSNDVVYTDVEFRAVDGETIIDDPSQIYWSIEDSEPQNTWMNARFTYSNQYYSYSSRDLISQYEYDEMNDKLIEITKPEGNTVSLSIGTGWKSSFIVKDMVELDDNLLAQSQFLVNEYDYDLKGRTIRKATFMVEDDGTTPFTGDDAYPRAILTFTYDGLDRVLSKQGGESSTIEILSHIYDDDNRIATTTDYLGFRKKTHYDGLFRPIETESFKPDSDACRNITHEEDHDVRVGHTKSTYDVMSGKVFEATQFTDNDGAGEHRVIIRTHYDKQSRVIRTEQKNTDTEYADSNRFDLINEMQYLDEENAAVTIAYLSNVAESLEFIRTKVENDWLGRGVSKESSWTGKNGTGSVRTMQYFYDYAGNQVKIQLPSGEEYNKLYNSAGKLEKILYPDGTFSLVNYDKNGRVTHTLDRRLAEISTSFNKADLAVVVASTDPTFGAIHRRVYHSHLGPASVVETQNAVELLKEEYHYHYTGNPTLVRQTADATVRELIGSYDASGNQLTLGVNSPTGQAWSKTLKIDAQYHPTSPDADHFNRVMIGTNENPSRRIVTQNSDYLGLLATVQFSDGAGTDRGSQDHMYDRFLRLRYNGSSDNELNITLTRDFRGDILSRKEPEDGSRVDLGYTYDGMSRLISAEGQDLSYDELSNLSMRGTGTYTYQETEEKANQMRLKRYFDGTNTFDYLYDDNGNLTSVSGRFSALSYDNLNRLRRIDYAGGQIDKYWYNAQGLRFKREEHCEGATSEKTYTMYVGEIPVVQERYLGSVKSETRFNVIASIGGQPRVVAQIKKVYGGAETLAFFYTDHIGSRRVALNGAGTVEDKFEYTAWGEMSHTQGTHEEFASFTGKEYDATGLLYCNARYYDPQVGRFLTEDPSRKGTGWYTYCGNNPINRIDPTGMKEELGDYSNTAEQQQQLQQQAAADQQQQQQAQQQANQAAQQQQQTPASPSSTTPSNSPQQPTLIQRIGDWLGQNAPKLTVGMTGDILGYNSSSGIELAPQKGFKPVSGQSFTVLSLAGASLDVTVGEVGSTEITLGASRWIFSVGANLDSSNKIVGLSAHVGIGVSTGISVTGGDYEYRPIPGQKAP